MLGHSFVRAQALVRLRVIIVCILLGFYLLSTVSIYFVVLLRRSKSVENESSNARKIDDCEIHYSHNRGLETPILSRHKCREATKHAMAIEKNTQELKKFIPTNKLNNKQQHIHPSLSTTYNLSTDTN